MGKRTAVLLLALTLSLLAACDGVHLGRETSPERPLLVHLPMLASDGASISTFTVTGHVLAGPTCPVERIPPDPNCAPRPVSGAVVLFMNEDGLDAKSAVSAANGAFLLMLPRGTYTMVPQTVPGLLRRPPPSLVVVDGAVDLTVMYDTGIR